MSVASAHADDVSHESYCSTLGELRKAAFGNSLWRRPLLVHLKTEATMARAGLLWLLGIPIPILLLMWVFGWLH